MKGLYKREEKSTDEQQNSNEFHSNAEENQKVIMIVGK